MKQLFIATAILSILLFAAGCKSKKNYVVIETEHGHIVVRLYEETPIHRDNFRKLADEGFYDGLLFHRVIHEFMIQGGDPDSRDAESGQRLGAGDPQYMLDAEIVYPQYFHRKGAIAAARQGDQVNPERKSSGSQFYLVHGQVYTNEELDQFENMKTERQKQQVFLKYVEPYRETLTQLQQNNDREAFQALMQQITKEAEPEMNEIPDFKFPEEHREVYTTIGGVPHLDGEYTVFGEVIEGLDVIDSIAKVNVNHMDRPVENIKMEIRKGKK